MRASIVTFCCLSHFHNSPFDSFSCCVVMFIFRSHSSNIHPPSSSLMPQLHLDATLKAPPHRAHHALFFLPLFLDVLHSAVHHTFSQSHNYARWFANGEFGDASKRRMALLMDALFDPNFRVSALQKPMAVWGSDICFRRNHCV
jgi:hypothetical protein